jgi:uncharacterized protein YkwD
MPKSRVRKGRKPYRPRPVPSGAPGTATRPAPAQGQPPADSGTARASGEKPRITEGVARWQRQVIGSEPWRRGVEDQVTVLVNGERRTRGLPPLRGDERLRRSARAHSADMAARHFFAHEAPDGQVPAGRMRAQGYGRPAAENIAQGQLDPHRVVLAWMASPGHRANILLPSARSIGVGLHQGDGGPWWTQHFGYE